MEVPGQIQNIFSLYDVSKIESKLHSFLFLSIDIWNQSGGVEAWWAHNQQDPGSKPRSDINVRGLFGVTIYSGRSDVTITQRSQKENLVVI